MFPHDKDWEKIVKERKEQNQSSLRVLHLVSYRSMIIAITIAGLGLLVPFGLQFFPIPFEYHPVIWNSYISIVLGITASIGSLFSIWLSYQSQKEAMLSNERTIDDFNSIRQEIISVTENIRIMNRKIDEMGNPKNAGKSGSIRQQGPDVGRQGDECELLGCDPENER